MRLLICTQTVDRPDPALGFFHRLIEKLAPHFERVEVICLGKGTYSLPSNVHVHSLGKEYGRASRLRYAWRFFRLLQRTHGMYDAVLVHMNQEYILLGGWWWKLGGKKIYFWRNHYEGSLLTRFAGAFCTKVFYTSKFSYTASFPRSVRMPVGVDVESVRGDVPVERVPRSILFLARLDEPKRPHLLLDALGMLKSRGIEFTATIVGGPTDPASPYPAHLRAQAKKLGLEGVVTFTGAVPNTETFRYYRSHEIFVNASRSGMFDKTMFKAVASGCVVLASSADFGELAGREFTFKDNDATDLANKLEHVLAFKLQERAEHLERLRHVVQENSLDVLVERLAAAMGGK